MVRVEKNQPMSLIEFSLDATAPRVSRRKQTGMYNLYSVSRK
jgi:hypothetical protein